MGFQLSPGVVTSEIDLTTIVPAVATSTGAYAGPFNWGPAEIPISISDEVRLAATFGKPTANASAGYATEAAYSFFTCANFLAYGNDLRVVRSYDPGIDNNATSAAGTANVSVKNDDVYFNTVHYNDKTSEMGPFIARYPGPLGNSLRVDVWANNNATAMSAWNVNTGTANVSLGSLFTAVPGTSAWASGIVPKCNDEIHIVVTDEDGLITGTKGTVLEVYPFLSKATDAKDDQGNSNYFREVLYKKSNYVYASGFGSNNSSVLNTTPTGGGAYDKAWGQTITNLSSGQGFRDSNALSYSLVRGNLPTSAHSQGAVGNAYAKFANSEEIDISLVLAGGHGAGIQGDIIDKVVEKRLDCVAFLSPPLEVTQVTNANPADTIAAWRNKTGNYATSGFGKSTSYAVMDSAWKYQYDKYNDMYRWLPSNGDMAGLCVRTDATRDPWFSPAGITRGQIKNLVKLSFNPNKAERDTLYKNGVNPLVSFPGEGTILFGDKTLLSKPSAFDRINVRRLFIVLEKAIARAARSSLFEFNDEFTRSQFVSIVEPFLRDVKGRRGIYDFRVVCDTTNNTPEVIDRNEFRGDIYVKPARSINFIQLNFVAVRTGVSFDEVVGKF